MRRSVSADLGLNCLQLKVISVKSAYLKINFLISQPKHML